MTRASLQSEGVIKAVLAVATILNIPSLTGKRALWLPAQRARFLGFLLDESQQCFLLPEEQSHDRSLLQTCSASTQGKDRPLAQVAGKQHQQFW